MKVYQELFERELNQIQSEDIRRFAEYIFDKAPAYFYFVPSSSSGKWHPPQDQGEGGLVRHTKAVVYFADRLCSAYNIEGRRRDLILVACGFHDLTKYSVPMQKHTTKTHGKEAADYIIKLWNENQIIPREDAMTICKCVAHHMGRWTVDGKKFPEEYTIDEIIVHTSDMLSSSKEVTLGFLEENLIG